MNKYLTKLAVFTWSQAQDNQGEDKILFGGRPVPNHRKPKVVAEISDPIKKGKKLPSFSGGEIHTKGNRYSFSVDTRGKDIAGRTMPIAGHFQVKNSDLKDPTSLKNRLSKSLSSHSLKLPEGSAEKIVDAAIGHAKKRQLMFRVAGSAAIGAGLALVGTAAYKLHKKE